MVLKDMTPTLMYIYSIETLNEDTIEEFN